MKEIYIEIPPDLEKIINQLIEISRGRWTPLKIVEMGVGLLAKECISKIEKTKKGEK